MVDRQREVPEVPRQHDAIVAPRALYRHVLVENVVENPLRGAVEWISPAAASPVVILVALASLVVEYLLRGRFANRRTSP